MMETSLLGWWILNTAQLAHKAGRTSKAGSIHTSQVVNQILKESLMTLVKVRSFGRFAWDIFLGCPNLFGRDPYPSPCIDVYSTN